MLTSFHNADGTLCIDIFVRLDGTFGFDEFRKDVEDVGGWLPLHRYSNQVFETLQQAEQTAKTAVPWLSRMTRIITVYEQKPKVM